MKVHEAPAAAWGMLAHSLKLLDGWDWQGLVDVRARADTIGHIFDPTGYRELIHDKQAAKNLELAKALIAFLRVAHETHPEVFQPPEGREHG